MTIISSNVSTARSVLGKEVMDPCGIFARSGELDINRKRNARMTKLTINSSGVFSGNMSKITPGYGLVPVRMFSGNVYAFSSMADKVVCTVRGKTGIMGMSVNPGFEKLSVLPLPSRSCVTGARFGGRRHI